jgi:hypothetical protein
MSTVSTLPYIAKFHTLAGDDQPSFILHRSRTREYYVVGTPEYYAQLETLSSFTVDLSASNDREKVFTARRETRKGINYWYAHRYKCKSVYLGHSKALTPDKLIVAANTLAERAAPELARRKAAKKPGVTKPPKVNKQKLRVQESIALLDHLPCTHMPPNAELKANQAAARLGLSRAQFYKLKAQTSSLEPVDTERVIYYYHKDETGEKTIHETIRYYYRASDVDKLIPLLKVLVHNGQIVLDAKYVVGTGL